MGTKITISISGTTFEAELNDSKAAKAIEAKLPVEIGMSRWGQEYYGSIGIGMGKESGERDVLEIGEIAYWPPGDALCIFFGPTPASSGDEPRAASPVVPLGRLHGGIEKLKGMSGSVRAHVELGTS